MGEIKSTTVTSDRVPAASSSKPKAVEATPKQSEDEFPYESSYELSPAPLQQVGSGPENDLDDIPF
jgi:hypothetical protein